jgi:type I restriction enzyme S subunit
MKWRTVKLDEIKAQEKGSLVSGPFGSNIGSRFFVAEGIPVIRGNNLSMGDKKFIDDGFVFITEDKARELKNCNAKSDDIIFTAAGTLGQVGLIPKTIRFRSYIISNKQIRLRLDTNQAFPPFVYYFLSSPDMRAFIASQNKGSSVPLLTLGIVRNLKILLPSPPIQKKIAAILSAYDELIENNKQLIALLGKMAEEIYREWFVRLRFPGHEKVKLVKGVPETWDNTRFGKFCMLKRGYDLPDKSVEPGDYPVIASTSIKTYHNEFKAKPPVITTGRSGSLGTVLMVNCEAWPLNTALYVKDFFGNSPYLVFYTLKNMGLENFNSGAGVPTLNRNHIDGIKIAVPDKDLQRRFDAMVSPMHEQKEQIIKANEALTQMRDTILPRLISGKLSVENLDIQFPPSMAEEAEAVA